MNPSQTSETLNLVCPNCATKNRLPARRAMEEPHCGKCSAILLPAAPIVLSDLNFERFVAGTDLPVVVDFYADWCGPCRTMAPQFAGAAADAKGRALFVKVDSDASPATAARFAVRSIPTVVRLNHGAEVERFSGVRGAADLLRFALG
ncbi:MAG: thioredoxin domain-containing protein [Burkholderiaceae bacterium]